MRTRIELRWLDENISKLEKRLEGQKKLSKTLAPDSMLRFMSDRVIYDMERRLFQLRVELRDAEKLEGKSTDMGAAA